MSRIEQGSPGHILITDYRERVGTGRLNSWGRQDYSDGRDS